MLVDVACTAVWMERVSALTNETAMRVFGFSVSSQMEQLRQRIDMRFAIHHDQALQKITGIIR
mgnify:CR=1 FL=1